jgi:hypothetical protein
VDQSSRGWSSLSSRSAGQPDGELARRPFGLRGGLSAVLVGRRALRVLDTRLAEKHFPCTKTSLTDRSPLRPPKSAVVVLGEVGGPLRRP